MDQDHFPPLDFALPGFAALVKLTMAAQQLDHDQAVIFLEQCWAQTSLRGVHPIQGNDVDLEGDGDAPGCPNQDTLQAPEVDDPRGDQAQPG